MVMCSLYLLLWRQEIDYKAPKEGFTNYTRKDKLFNTNRLHKEEKLNKLKWRRKQHLGQLMFHATK